jgi:glycosyltransferase involved in cell wall biosynthesis
MISIITPIYNPDNLERTVVSLKEQTSKNFEWIIVVDDAYERINIEDYNLEKRLDVRVKYTYLGSNYGPSVARNVGFMLSDGDIITYVDCGDTLDKERVRGIEWVFEKYPEAKLFFSGYLLITPDETYRYDPRLIQSQYHSNVKEHLQHANLSIPLGVAHTRDIFYNAGMFQRGIVCGEDGILWRRMVDIIEGGECIISDAISGQYYISNCGQSRTQRRFDEGGYAFDASNSEGSHGQYLDKNYFETYNVVSLFDKKE